MEHIIRDRIYPEAASPVPKLRLSPLVVIVFSVVLGFTAVIISMMAVGQYEPPRPNPFPSYADIFPGQPESAVASRSFSCKKDYDYYLYGTSACTFTPAAGDFSNIQVIVSEGLIHQITFIMRDNTFSVGDLARLLGMPIVHRFYHMVYFFSPTSVVRAKTVGRGEQFSLFLPVWSISFAS